MSETKIKGNWSKLYNELKRRFLEPTGETTFVLYFVFIIVILGGLGFLIPVAQLCFKDYTHADLMAIPPNIITYAFAIAATAFVDLLMSKVNVSRPIWLTVWTLWGLSVLISVTAYFPSRFRWTLILSILGMIFSLLLWWITNCDKTELKDDFPDPDSMSGGKTEIISGSTQNIQLGQN